MTLIKTGMCKSGICLDHGRNHGNTIGIDHVIFGQYMSAEDEKNAHRKMPSDQQVQWRDGNDGVQQLDGFWFVNTPSPIQAQEVMVYHYDGGRQSSRTNPNWCREWPFEPWRQAGRAKTAVMWTGLDSGIKH